MTTTNSPDLATLEAEIDTYIAESGAEFGVALHHLESGAVILRNPDALYPLASVVKVPILIEALAQVDDGKQSLEARIELRQEDKVLPSGILVTLNPGLQPTLHDLLMLMIIISDNTATDLVLHEIGIENVQERLRIAGCSAISVRLNIRGLFDATFESPDVSMIPAEASAFIAAQEARNDSVTLLRSLENNVASPRDMALLLGKLARGELLSAEGTRVALDIMLRQQLNARIPRFMFDTVKIAHKTGTFRLSRNDAGIIFLPDGSHLVIVTFAMLDPERADADPRESMPYVDLIDSTMGRIARSAYDAFTGT